MSTVRTYLALAVLASAAAAAHAQGAKERCLQAAKADLAACQAKLPPNVTPKDPKNPTPAEKEAMTKYTKESNACNEKGAAAALACK